MKYKKDNSVLIRCTMPQFFVFVRAFYQYSRRKYIDLWQKWVASQLHIIIGRRARDREIWRMVKRAKAWYCLMHENIIIITIWCHVSHHIILRGRGRHACGWWGASMEETTTKPIHPKLIPIAFNWMIVVWWWAWNLRWHEDWFWRNVPALIYCFNWWRCHRGYACSCHLAHFNDAWVNVAWRYWLLLILQISR